MRVTESTLLVDRIVIAVRWLGIILIAILLGNGKSIDGNAIGLLAVTSIWNLALTILTMMGRRFPFHSYITVGVDAVLGLAFFYFAALGTDPFVWGGLLPVLTVSFYHGLQGSLIVSIGMLVIEGLVLVRELPDDVALGYIGLPAGVMVVGGVVLGGLAQQMGYLLRQRRAEELSRVDEEERIERERIKALYNITASMTATLNYQRVLDMALDLTASALSEPREGNLLVSAFCLFEGDEFRIGSSRRFTPADLKATLNGASGLLAKSLQTGAPQITRQPERDPELKRIVALRECGVVYCFPLRTTTEDYGALIFGHPEKEYFGQKRREILEIVGRQAMLALQNARLYQELEDEKERMTEIQEEARKKLARNLHDGPTQSVAAIAMRVNFARRMMERDVQTAGEELFKIEDLARRTTKEIRHMLFTLRPLVLETSGLVAALESLAGKMKETYGQNVLIEADEGVLVDLEMGKQGVIFYIAEEGINNARKHAEAEHIFVRIKKLKGDVFLLEVEDDGVGFNVGEVDTGYDQRGSLGMVNMRERTELVNGVLRLQSAVGKGTRIRVWVPMNEDAADRLRNARLG